MELILSIDFTLFVTCIFSPLDIPYLEPFPLCSWKTLSYLHVSCYVCLEVFLGFQTKYKLLFWYPVEEITLGGDSL